MNQHTRTNTMPCPFTRGKAILGLILLISATNTQGAAAVGRVQGILVNQDGRPVSDARVELGSEKAGASEYRTTSSDDGVIELSNIRPGPYVLRIWARGFERKAIDVHIGGRAETALGSIQLRRIEDGQSRLIIDDFGYLMGSYRLPCADDLELLRDSDHSLVTIGSDELERRALSRADPVWPAQGRAPQWISVYLAIGANGRVLCATVSGSKTPFAEAAIAAAQKWVTNYLTHLASRRILESWKRTNLAFTVV